MPLYAQSHLPIPKTDLLTWSYSNRSTFDQNKPLYIDAADPRKTISANQAWTLIHQLIAGLHAAGLQNGDCVCIHAFNNLYYPILVQGIIGAGGVFVGTNPAYTEFELRHALRVSKAKFVVTECDLLPAIQQPAEEAGIDSKSQMWLFDEPKSSPGIHLWRTLLSHGEATHWFSFDDLETSENTTAMLFFSSGTTGLPKAAQLSHYNLIAQHTIVHENPAHLQPFAVSRIACLPFFHAAMGPFIHTSVLRSGFQAYVMRRFALAEYLTYSLLFRITQHILVPPMVVAIVNLAHNSRAGEDTVRKAFGSTKSIYAGAAPLDAATQASLQKLLPADGVFTQIWAMSETSCYASMLYYPENDDTGSVGRFMPGLDVKLVDPDADETTGPAEEIWPPYDTRGELCIRGPTVVRGYLENPEANARDWDADGFFHTGDILYCDGKTKLWYIVDRKKELIKVRGFQVAPNEIEGVLLSMPGVRDVAVIGVPAPAAGSELPRAYVVKENEEVTEEAIREWVGARLAGYKRLDGGVVFVEAVPRNASGKILKRVLREQAKREMGSKI